MLVIFPVSSYAEQDYKCYLELANKKGKIANHFANSSQQAKVRLKKSILRKTGQDIELSAIKECIRIQDEFSSYQAHKLDMITPQ